MTVAALLARPISVPPGRPPDSGQSWPAGGRSLAARPDLATLYRRYARELLSAARRRLGLVDADDVVQEAFLRFAVYADQGSLANPRAYLHRVAAHATADRGAALGLHGHRHEPDTALEAVPALAAEPGEVLDARARLRRCLTALEELPAAQRHAFLLHRVDGLSQRDVAKALGLPLRTVERHIARALARCVEQVEP